MKFFEISVSKSRKYPDGGLVYIVPENKFETFSIGVLRQDYRKASIDLDVFLFHKILECQEVNSHVFLSLDPDMYARAFVGWIIGKQLEYFPKKADEYEWNHSEIGTIKFKTLYLPPPPPEEINGRPTVY